MISFEFAWHCERVTSRDIAWLITRELYSTRFHAQFHARLHAGLDTELREWAWHKKLLEWESCGIGGVISQRNVHENGRSILCGVEWVISRRIVRENKRVLPRKWLYMRDRVNDSRKDCTCERMCHIVRGWVSYFTRDWAWKYRARFAWVHVNFHTGLRERFSRWIACENA